MPFLGGADSRGLKKSRIRRECTLAPPGKYDGIICTAAAMRAIAAITAAIVKRSLG